MVPQIDKVWDGFAHSHNMVGGAREGLYPQMSFTHHINIDAFSYDAVKIS